MSERTGPPKQLRRLRFGVNYVPSRRWWYCWNDFHDEEIAGDLDAVAGLRCDHIRIMVIWPYFQPNPGWVSPAHLERLRRVMEIAGERKLAVCVAVLNGHLTGQDFRPGYERGGGLYGNPRTEEAAELLFREIAGAIGECGNFLGFDLGNEMNCCWRAESPGGGDAWFLRTMELVEELAPGKVHVNGVDHQPWFSGSTFSPATLASRQPTVALHCWINSTGALERGGPLDLPAVGLVPAMAALARGYAGDPSKPVWVQEYGASNAWMDPGDIPTFLEKATRWALAAGATWFTWWASHDIDPKFKVKSLEYSLGLLAVDQRVKPQGKRFRELAEEFRKQGPPKSVLPPCPSPKEVTPEATWKELSTWMKANPAGGP